MNERFPEKYPGDRLSAAEVNKLQDAVERGSSTGHGDDSVDVGSFKASRSAQPQTVVMFRIVTESVSLESSCVADDDGPFPQLYNAVRQSWDEDSGQLIDVEDGYEFLENPYSQAFDQGDLVSAAFYENAWFILPHKTVHLAVTCKEPNGLAGDGVTVGWYPAEADGPTVYCIAWVNIPYPPTPGKSTIPADTSASPVSGDDVAVIRMTSQPQPHAYVMNLGGGYLPEGTLVACFQSGQRWFTMGPPVVAGGGGGGSGVTVTDGTHTFSGVTQINVSASGVVSQPFAGQATVTYPDAAVGVAHGWMTNTGQTFAGDKTFTGNVYVTAGTGVQFGTGIGLPVINSTTTPGCLDLTALQSSSTRYMRVLMFGDSGVNPCQFLIYASNYSSAGASIDGYAPVLTCYAIQDATGARHTGFTGTVASAPVYGGIITGAVTKPTVTGSKASGAALASLLAALVTLGLITDTTTP